MTKGSVKSGDKFDWAKHYANHGPYDVLVEESFISGDPFPEHLCVRLSRDGQQQLFLYDIDIDHVIAALKEAREQAQTIYDKKARRESRIANASKKPKARKK